MWRCVSTIPGITMPRRASISTVPSGTSSARPTASIFSPTTSTSASCSTDRLASIVSTIPLRNTVAVVIF